MSFACGPGACACDFCIQRITPSGGRTVYTCFGREAVARGSWRPTAHQVRFTNRQLLRAHLVQHILEGSTIHKNPFGVLSEQQED